MSMCLMLIAAAAMLWPRHRHAPAAPPASRKRVVARAAVPAWIVAASAGAAVLVIAGTGARGVLLACGIAIAAHRAVHRARAAAASSASAQDERDAPLFLDLVASQLQMGAPVVRALEQAAPLAPNGARAAVLHTAGLVRLGAAPGEAWMSLAGTSLEEFGLLARRSTDSGVRLADQCRLLAREIRERRAAQSEAAAQRAGVWAMAPLGLCFLPAFFCLGIAPIMIGLGGALLTA
jgi:Flp pilus assembly protein TadB